MKGKRGRRLFSSGSGKGRDYFWWKKEGGNYFLMGVKRAEVIFCGGKGAETTFCYRKEGKDYFLIKVKMVDTIVLVGAKKAETIFFL